MRLEAPDDSGLVQPLIVSLVLGRPEVPAVTVAGTQTQRVLFAPPTADAAHGTWFWDQARLAAVIAIRPGQPSVKLDLTNLVMVSLAAEVTDAQFWTAATALFIQFLAYQLGQPTSNFVVLAAPPSSGRHLLATASSGTFDVAWISAGVSAPDLEVRLSDLASAALAVRVPNLTVSSVLSTYVSAPLCNAATGVCACPFSNVTVDTQTNETCPLPPPPPPPPPAPPTPRVDAVAIVSGSLSGAACVVLFATYMLWRTRTMRRNRRTIARGSEGAKRFEDIARTIVSVKHKGRLEL